MRTVDTIAVFGMCFMFSYGRSSGSAAERICRVTRCAEFPDCDRMLPFSS